jgi:hypothetical protein
LHHSIVLGCLGNVVTQQEPDDLQQKISAGELEKVDLRQGNPFRWPASSSEVLGEGVLQQNKPAEPPDRASLLRDNDVLHQKNSAGHPDRLF